jgi:hypothetical protein
MVVMTRRVRNAIEGIGLGIIGTAAVFSGRHAFEAGTLRRGEPYESALVQQAAIAPTEAPRGTFDNEEGGRAKQYPPGAGTSFSTRGEVALSTPRPAVVATPANPIQGSQPSEGASPSIDTYRRICLNLKPGETAEWCREYGLPTTAGGDPSRYPTAAPNILGPAGSESLGDWVVEEDANLFEEPDEDSRVVGRLHRRALVEVVRRIGPWLEIRSHRGNPDGFIRAIAARPRADRYE